VAAAATMAASLVVLTVGLGYFDGTGLFAPENWVDAGAMPTFATSPAWSTVTFVPILIFGSAVALYATVRAARPGVRARWVLGAAWSSVVLTAFLAKVMYSSLLLLVAGPDALHPWPTVAAVLAECGLTGAKYAFFGVLAAGPAALAYLVATRRRRVRDGQAGGQARADATGAASAEELPRCCSVPSLLAGALLASAVAGSGYPWIEGSGRAVILPACGLLGSWAAAQVIWPRVARELTAHRGSTAWARTAVTFAACGAGFLLPFVVDGLVSGFGGALYPIVGALMHVAAGVTAGACACAVESAWLLLCSLTPAGAIAGRIGTRPAGRYGLQAVALGLVLCVGVLPGALARAPGGYPVPRAASPGSGGLLALTVLRSSDQAPVIGDSAGRVVLLRGVNVNQLVDYGQPNRSLPTVRPLGAADYALMASTYGFDVQRLNLSWSKLEPTPGSFSRAYLARIRTAVNEAAAHGIYTVLDMHQDTYSKYVTARPGTTCRPGATPEFGNDGAPKWATLTDGAKACGFMGRDLSPNVEQSFTNLYDNTDGIGAQLADTWGRLAEAFAGDTAVAGYDLLNEAGPGDAPGITSSLLLGRLYQQIIAAIRAGEDRAPGGFHHLIFFEPSILWSGLGFDVTPPVGFSSDPDLVFSPHLYSQSITMDQSLGVTLVTIQQGFTTAERTAAAYGVPLWSGEWGWFGTGQQVGARFDTFLNLQNSDLLGSAIWVWKKACGDPQSSPNEAVAGGINLYSCKTGKNVPSPAFQTTALSQAYPRAAPGLLSLSSSATSVHMKLAGNGAGMLEVWIPGTARPRLIEKGLTGLTLTAQPGSGWLLTARAAGRYALVAR
jgi:hypothetical protein